MIAWTASPARVARLRGKAMVSATTTTTTLGVIGMAATAVVHPTTTTSVQIVSA